MIGSTKEYLLFQRSIGPKSFLNNNNAICFEKSRILTKNNRFPGLSLSSYIQPG